MSRLFAALEIPPKVAHELALARGGLLGARWVDESDLHLTLRFIGDVDERTAEEIDAELSEIRKPAFTVTLQELDAFGGDKPRAIVVKAQASPELLALQSKIEARLRRLGVAAEPRKFAPHVTLAWLRAASRPATAGYLASRGYFQPIRFVAERFALFSARDLVGGGPYVLESVYPLQTPQAPTQAVGP
jgi:2'-5' RNA ligase